MDSTGRETSRWRRFPWTPLVLLLASALVIGLLIASVVPFRNFFDGLFNRDTYTATGDVVLKKLQESQELEVATGSYDVPVVVCNGSAKAYEEFGVSADELLRTCDGFSDEKATVIIRSEVPAVIDLDSIKPGDVTIDGKRITIKVPRPRLGEPVVDAEKGVMIVGIDSSILPGKLPDDYLSRAAGAGKSAVSSVAADSGLIETGERSATSIFEGLLESFGFTEVTIEFEDPPAP